LVYRLLEGLSRLDDHGAIGLRLWLGLRLPSPPGHRKGKHNAHSENQQSHNYQDSPPCSSHDAPPFYYYAQVLSFFQSSRDR
jgi:hypothetical protein